MRSLEGLFSAPALDASSSQALHPLAPAADGVEVSGPYAKPNFLIEFELHIQAKFDQRVSFGNSSSSVSAPNLVTNGPGYGTFDSACSDLQRKSMNCEHHSCFVCTIRKLSIFCISITSYL